MPVADLLKNDKVIVDGLKGDHRIVAKDYVKRRVRTLIAGDASLADPRKRGDITAAATPGVATKLIAEMPKVKAAFDAIWKRVGNDVAQNRHVPIDSPTLRKRVSDRPPTGDARTMRRRLVLSIVYQAAANDPSLADPANVERLHRLCDRRLRLVERMLYEVGRYPRRERKWSHTQISGHPGGPWIDGLERAFEYPRVPSTFFEKVCAPGPDDLCKAPMTGWKLGDDDNIVGPHETNPATTARWRPTPPPDGYELHHTPAVADSPKAVAAINELFAPSPDYRARNHLYCDHTIHALHLEALVFAESKRQPTAGDTSWLDGVVKSKPAGWLRLSVPLGVPGSLRRPDFLAASGEPAFFEHAAIRVEDLQVGDHLIIYNHPAYEHTTINGAWRLENAVVVQTAPKLLFQGHGSALLTIDAAKATMLDLFQKALAARRGDVGPLAAVKSSGANRVTVDSVAKLRTGMRIEIVDAKTEAPLAPDLQITAIDIRRRVVQYAGTSVTATSKHVVRRRRISHWGGKYEGIVVGSATSGRTLDLLRRVPAASSEYAPPHNQLADWYVAWLATPTQEEIRTDPDRAKFVKERQLVDFTRETEGTTTMTVGWFPLWEPARRRKQVVRKAGKIAGIQPVTVGAGSIAAWTWFVDPDVSKALVPVIRPKVA